MQRPLRVFFRPESRGPCKVGISLTMGFLGSRWVYVLGYWQGMVLVCLREVGEDPSFRSKTTVSSSFASYSFQVAYPLWDVWLVVGVAVLRFYSRSVYSVVPFSFFCIRDCVDWSLLL